MSSSAGVGGTGLVPVTLLQYRDMSNRNGQEKQGAANLTQDGELSAEAEKAAPKFTAAQLEAEVERAGAEAAQEVERRLHAEYEQKLWAAREPIARTMASIEEQKDEYFSRVEAEVIQLALSIAQKILHREAQVDPMLVASLVRLALEKMKEGSNVVIRVGMGRGASWRNHLAGIPSLTEVEVVEDAQLTDLDCIVETELGSANFGLDSQLKEVEQGFFDLLALRPVRG
jgi:flagellar assembly protein FliH